MRSTTGQGMQQNKETLQFMLEIFECALEEGHDPDLLANAALFTALSGLVGTYGEAAVIGLAEDLPRRIADGEFTTRRLLQ